MLHLTKLKNILQSNIFYICLSFIIIGNIFIKTVLIRYESHIQDFDNVIGIITDIDYKENNISFILQSSEKVRCIYYYDDKNEIKNLLGKKVRISGEETKTYNNTIPNTFNYKKYLYNNKIYLSLKVRKIEEIRDSNIFYKIKNKIINHINNYDEKVKTYLNLFILGDKSTMDSNIYDVYRNNGIWHLFAISGMHISLIIFILSVILRKFKYKKIPITIFLIYFMFLANFSPSLLRASLFFVIKNVLEFFNCKIKPWQVLVLVGAILIIINPFIVYNMGFLYSFIITFSIMSMSKFLVGNYFSKIFKISLISFIVSLPITASMNYEVNILSIFLNIFYVPFISLIVFPICILCFFIPILSNLLLLLINILEVTNNFFSNISLNILIPKMNIIIIIFYYCFIILLFKLKKKIMFVFLIILLFINYIYLKLDRAYYVYYMDVGQGDSSILISPYKREVIMIDTGGSNYNNYHVSDNVILFLKSIGIAKINLLILSHGDYDHAGETINILNKFKVDNIIINNGNMNDLEKEIYKLGNVVNDYKSSYFKYENIKKYYSNDENESSIITYFNIYNNSLLFMGDTSKNVERQFMNEYKVKVDFIKLAHHGSKTSSDYEFLKKINPELAVISSGRNNIYHHPSDETIATLDSLNINYLNTQTSGTIMLELKKNGHTIKEFKP